MGSLEWLLPPHLGPKVRSSPTEVEGCEIPLAEYHPASRCWCPRELTLPWDFGPLSSPAHSGQAPVSQASKGLGKEQPPAYAPKRRLIEGTLFPALPTPPLSNAPVPQSLVSPNHHHHFLKAAIQAGRSLTALCCLNWALLLRTLVLEPQRPRAWLVHTVP